MGKLIKSADYLVKYKYKFIWIFKETNIFLSQLQLKVSVGGKPKI